MLGTSRDSLLRLDALAFTLMAAAYAHRDYHFQFTGEGSWVPEN